MKRSTTLMAAFVGVLSLSACERETVVTTPAQPPVVATTEPAPPPVTVPVPVPGPPGPQGEQGQPGTTGASGTSSESTTVIVTPPTAASEPK